MTRSCGMTRRPLILTWEVCDSKMDSTEICMRVRRSVAKVAGLIVEDVPADATFNALDLDSLSRIEILVELEREFKLDIPEDENAEEDLVARIQTVPQAIQLVE
ncbi:MAG: acyl carrier protein [Betaproteobacteria bacterium]